MGALTLMQQIVMNQIVLHDKLFLATELIFIVSKWTEIIFDIVYNTLIFGLSVEKTLYKIQKTNITHLKKSWIFLTCKVCSIPTAVCLVKFSIHYSSPVTGTVSQFSLYKSNFHKWNLVKSWIFPDMGVRVGLRIYNFLIINKNDW